MVSFSDRYSKRHNNKNLNQIKVHLEFIFTSLIPQIRNPEPRQLRNAIQSPIAIKMKTSKNRKLFIVKHQSFNHTKHNFSLTIFICYEIFRQFWEIRSQMFNNFIIIQHNTKHIN